MTTYLLLCGLAALGVAWLYRLAVPTAPLLTREVGAWQRSRAVATRRAAGQAPVSRGDRWTAAGLDVIDRYRPDVMHALDQNLSITGETRLGWATRTALLAAACLVVPTALLPVFVARGLAFTSAGLLLLIGLVLACAAVLIAVRDLSRRAAIRREEFRRGLSLYLDLVVMSLEAGRGHAEALPTVAGVGTGWVFGELRSAVTTARTRGITAWAALGRIGERLGVAELIDLQASIELAQDEGGRVRDSLVSRANSMRAARMVDIRSRAAAKTEAMRNTLVLMALLTAAYVITARLLYLVTV